MEWQPCKVLVAVKNFSNYKDDDKSYVKLIQSKARDHDQVKVIVDSYTKVSPLKESTPCRSNSKGIWSNLVDDSTCIRLLYLVQNVFDTRNAENLVTVTRNDVKTNSDCPMSTGVSIPKEANSRMIQHILWKLQKHINNLPILPTYWCRALGSSLGATIGYQLHSISCIFRTVLAALAGFEEGAEQSTEVVKSCEQFLCTPLCSGWLYITHVKKSGGIFQFHETWTRIKLTPVHGLNIKGGHMCRRKFDHGM